MFWGASDEFLLLCANFQTVLAFLFLSAILFQKSVYILSGTSECFRYHNLHLLKLTLNLQTFKQFSSMGGVRLGLEMKMVAWEKRERRGEESQNRAQHPEILLFPKPVLNICLVVSDLPYMMLIGLIQVFSQDISSLFRGVMDGEHYIAAWR